MTPSQDVSAGAVPSARAKISPVPSIGSGKSTTMSVGGTHNKFFGSGAASKKDRDFTAPAAGRAKAPRKARLSTNKKRALVDGLKKVNARRIREYQPLI